ncbi:MAG: hypothetical protein K0R50_2225 [Eubacterium sp.]|nr:hypothetical protein [Eubacterium sp.]
MIKSKFAKVFILSMCISVFSAAAVNAAVSEGGQSGASRGSGTVGITMVSDNPDEAVSSPAAVNEEILKKQNEIDLYLFKEHQKELEQKGISVTYTAPMDNYVEIGILPLNDENAQYLYGIFGKDKIKVVDGQKVIAMTAAADPQIAPDQAVQGNTGSEPVKGEIFTAEDAKRDVKGGTAEVNEGRVYKTTSAQENEQIYTTSAVADNTAVKSGNSTLAITLGAAAAVVVLGGTAIILRKRKVAAR